MKNVLQNTIKKHAKKCYPLLGHRFSAKDYGKIDLSRHNSDAERYKIDTFVGLQNYIQKCLQDQNAKIAIGGYLEDRIFYQSDLYQSKNKVRSIHLGIDIWAEEGTKIYVPLDAQVHSFRYNNNPLDYGGTIILEHKFDNLEFYTLYGHITLDSFDKMKNGDVIKKGQAFTRIGSFRENGGWVPHLHFQLITHIGNNDGDFVGVINRDEIEKYRLICPSPYIFFEKIII